MYRIVCGGTLPPPPPPVLAGIYYSCWLKKGETLTSFPVRDHVAAQDSICLMRLVVVMGLLDRPLLRSFSPSKDTVLLFLSSHPCSCLCFEVLQFFCAVAGDADATNRLSPSLVKNFLFFEAFPTFVTASKRVSRHRTKPLLCPAH